MTARTTKPKPKHTPEEIAAARAAIAEAEAEAATAAPTVIEEDGSVVSAPSTEVALPDSWAYETVEFADRTWEVRKPTDQALAGFALASGRFIDQATQNSVVGLFIKNHMSDASYDVLYARLLDPNDTEFDVSTIGGLMQAIATLGQDAPAEAS
jgi:hypothetical protein